METTDKQRIERAFGVRLPNWTDAELSKIASQGAANSGKPEAMLDFCLATLKMHPHTSDCVEG